MKQYESSTSINKLIDYRKSYFDTSWSDEFYNTIWNVDTAQGVGLDIWGGIVVIGRTLEVPDGQYFGFKTPDPQAWTPFNQAAFYAGRNLTQTYFLQDSAYRTLILAKAMSNISDTNSKSLNRVLMNLFPGRGDVYVVDKGGMEIDYVFEFYLEPWELTVVKSDNILPRPAGVKVNIVEKNDEIDAIYYAATRIYEYANITLPHDLKIN